MGEQPVGRKIQSGHYAVPASKISDNPYKCPHCGSTSLNVLGVFKREFFQEYKEGKTDKASVHMGEEATQEVEGLVCSSCEKHTVIEEDDIYEREMLIMDLQLQIAILQGRVSSVQPAKEWKN